MKRTVCILLLLSFLMTSCGEKKSIVEQSETIINSTKQIETEETSLQDIDNADDEVLEEREKCDFRNAKWGDSIETVKKYESELEFIGESDNGLVAETNLLGYDATVVYSFEDNALVRGTYLLDLGNSKGGRYIAAYNQFKDSMIEKYGNPFSDKIVPLTMEKLIETAGESAALELGYVAYITEWKTSTTDIMLSMMEQDYSIMFPIMYSDITHNFNRPNGL